MSSIPLELSSRILSICSSDLALNRQKNILFKGSTVPGSLLAAVLPHIPKDKGILSGYPPDDAARWCNDSNFDQELRAEIRRQLTPAKPDLNLNEVYFNPDIKVPMAALKVIFDVERPRNSFLYYPNEDTRYPMAYEGIKERLDSILGGRAGRVSYEKSNSLDCVVRYTPLRPRIYEHPDHTDVRIFNLWEEAEWEAGWTPPKSPVEAPEIFTQLLGHLTDKDDSRHYLGAWLRDATFGRAEPILLLCGIPGTGKNLFVEQVAGALVGRHNYRSASRGFRRTQFHSNVTNCRLFYLDETGLKDGLRDTLKAYHNGLASIERKGVDIGDPERLYASFAVSNNDEAKIELEYADRKFYAPDLAKESIEDRLGRRGAKAFADKVIAAMADPKTVRQLADYLYLTYPAAEVNNFNKNTETFARLALNSFPHWLRTLKAIVEKLGPKRTEVQQSRILGRGRRDYSETREVLLKYAQATGDHSITAQITSEGEWAFIVNPTAEEARGFELYENGHAAL